MTLAETLKKVIESAVKSSDHARRDIYKLALGEIQTTEERLKGITEDKAIRVVRTLINSNRETIAAYKEKAVVGWETNVFVLEEQNVFLEAILPKGLTQQEIEAALEPIKSDIVASNQEGKAIGMAMKLFKTAGSIVDPVDVTSVIRKLRVCKEASTCV